jgi:hypothetical protein
MGVARKPGAAGRQRGQLVAHVRSQLGSSLHLATHPWRHAARDVGAGAAVVEAGDATGRGMAWGLGTGGLLDEAESAGKGGAMSGGAEVPIETLAVGSTLGLVVALPNGSQVAAATAPPVATARTTTRTAQRTAGRGLPETVDLSDVSASRIVAQRVSCVL